MDPITVVLPSREHAQQLMAFLDAAPFRGLKAKRIVVECMEALEAALGPATKTEVPSSP